MVEIKSYVLKKELEKELEKINDKSERLERMIEEVKESLEKLEIVVEKLEEECYKTRYKNVEFGHRIERLECRLKDDKYNEDK
jgi:septal ring factor EnvC (AmiA/AmiB activator)